MIGLYGEFDVAVAGAGIAGITAAISAARQGVNTLLIEEGGVIGGMVTAGRLTKPHGLVTGGIYREMLRRAEEKGGAITATMHTSWGEFTGMFDPEVLQRVILEMLDEAGVEILLHARITDVVTGDRVRGLEVVVKSGRRIILSDVIVDATGDGDVAVLAGAEAMIGRSSDGKTQPMTLYMRFLNVDTPRLARYMQEHPNEFTEYVLPSVGETAGDYAFRLHATGFTSLIRQAREAGAWTVPKDHLTVKTGMLPGEINLNASRFHGNALDERSLSRAELELRKQSYEIFDFFRKYVPGFEQASIMDIASRIGVRETRRIVGDYVLSSDDVTGGQRFEDSIGLSKSGIDIHDPAGDKLFQRGIGSGYDIPYRCLLPNGIAGMLLAGRCISADEIAFGSIRQTPACALTGQAAGTGAALAVRAGIVPRRLEVRELQAALIVQGVSIGCLEPTIATPVES